jgi:hypothetical protein
VDSRKGPVIKSVGKSSQPFQGIIVQLLACPNRGRKRHRVESPRLLNPTGNRIMIAQNGLDASFCNFFDTLIGHGIVTDHIAKAYNGVNTHFVYSLEYHIKRIYISVYVGNYGVQQQ